MSSPPVPIKRVCANGSCRLRLIRARTISVGFLVLAASSMHFASPGNGLAQFPIRQFPSRAGAGLLTQPASAPQAAGPSNSAADTAATIPSAPLPAVARIVVPERDGISYGSGTLIDVRDQFGLIVSNWHVVRDAAGPITVEFPDGFRSPAQVVKTDKDWDLAALSIQRPSASPIRISPDAPAPGQPLAIAGYGSGSWRMAAGRCTQYLAPGVEFPHELVEVSAEARQGDSGGPILNERGEIAGVLFGSGPGYTSGSYGGRVLHFLASVVPGGAPGADGVSQPLGNLAASVPSLPPAITPPAATAEPPPITQPPQATALHQHENPPAAGPAGPYGAASPGTPDPGLHATLTPTADPLLAPPPPREVADRFGATKELGDEVDPRVAVAPRPIEKQASPLAPAALAMEPVPATFAPALAPRAGTEKPKTEDISSAPPEKLLAALWKRYGGESVFDQAKSVLAIIGFLAVVVVFLRFGSQKEPEHHEE